MKNISIVVGAGYDNTMDILNVTNSLCKTYQRKEPILVVLYTGGYCYSSHFGVGTLNGNVSTYITKNFLVEPESFCNEYDWYTSSENNIQPNVFINKKARLCFHSDILVNSVLWDKNDDMYDGGIYETYNRTDYQITIDDFLSYNADKKVDTIKKIYNYHVKWLKNLGLYKDSVLSDIMQDSNTLMKNINKYIVKFYEMCSHCTFVDDDYDVLSQYDNIIFQSALGILESDGNYCFYPDIVCYNTGIKYAVDMLERYMFRVKSNNAIDNEINDVQIYYVSRPYMTRQTKGRFDTENENLKNEYNIKYAHRVGYFDYINIVLEILYDISYINMTNIPYTKNFVFTEMDATENKILLPEQTIINNETNGAEIMKYIYRLDGESLIETKHKSLYDLREVE